MTYTGELDLVTMRVVENALGAICDDMFVTLQRVGRSPTATQVLDMSTGICDTTGDIVGGGGHVASVPGAMRHTLEKFAGRIEDGDVFVANDPYIVGLHMPDVVVYKPVFIDGVFSFFAVTVVHHVDIGGRTPGSMSHDSTDIYQEGFRMPPVKIMVRGKRNETLWDVLEKNVRGSATVADMYAQCVATEMGDRRLKELARQYGREQLLAYCSKLKDYSEESVRAAISTLPKGEYEFTDYIDEDGIDPDPIRIQVKLTIKNDELICDYTGTSPQTRGSLNITLAEATGSAFGAVSAILGANIPRNSGMFRRMKVIAPPGCLVNMLHPAACAARGLTTYRLQDAWRGVMAQVRPDWVAAANEGGTSTGRFGFTREDHTVKVMYDNMYGCPGGNPNRDAPDGLGSNMSNFSIEVLEKSYPMRIRRYGFVPDTEGKGKHRGAMAIMREWEFLQDAHITFRSDRRIFPPYGLAGGQPGTKSISYLRRNGQSEVFPAKVNTYMKRGDLLYHQTASGGGHGDPLERDPESVLKDYLEEKITVGHAREAYGVVINRNKRVDQKATMRRREELRMSSANKSR